VSYSFLYDNLDAFSSIEELLFMIGNNYSDCLSYVMLFLYKLYSAVYCLGFIF